MIDKRFYAINENVPASALAEAGQAKVAAGKPENCVGSFASAELAGANDLTFLETDKPLAPEQVKAGICFAPNALLERFDDSVTVITSDAPRWSFAKAAKLIATPIQTWTSDSVIHPSASLEDSVSLGPNVVIGPGAKIGAGTVIRAGSVIGAGVAVGRNCQIGSNVSITCALIGDNVIILSGTTIGETGFGLAPGPDGAQDTPHFGRVIIQDDVSLGANVCVDRGLFEDTVIEHGAKVDNLCQIAHNVKVGAHSVVAAFGGISGSVNVGQGAMLGGRVGIADHINIGDGAKLGAGSATMNDVPAGETWGGYPAKPIRKWMREVAWVSRQIQPPKKS